MSEDSKEKSIERARKKRIALAKEKNIKIDETDQRKAFKKYFLKTSKKYNIRKDLEDIIWIHLKTIKKDSEELFDQGLKHFGIKIK